MTLNVIIFHISMFHSVFNPYANMSKKTFLQRKMEKTTNEWKVVPFQGKCQQLRIKVG